MLIAWHAQDALCTDAKMETNTYIEALHYGSSTLPTTAILLHDGNGDTILGHAITNNAARRKMNQRCTFTLLRASKGLP